MKKKSVLPQLFFSTLYLSAFTFGGGYVIVSLMKKRFVDERHWIGEDEMLDLVAIAQSSPGPIAVNGAIVVGYKLAGLAGALTAAVATVIPPFVIIALVSYFYQLFRDNAVVSRVLSGMQAGVGAVIASVVWDMGADIARQKSVSSMLIMAAAFVLSCVCKVNVVYIVLGCIALGTARTLLGRRKAGCSFCSCSGAFCRSACSASAAVTRPCRSSRRRSSRSTAGSVWRNSPTLSPSRR